MGPAQSMASIINGLQQLGIQPSLSNKRQLAANFPDADPQTFDAAYQSTLRNETSKFGSIKTSLNMEDAIQALMSIPSITPAVAADMLIEKGADADQVRAALENVDMDRLDVIDGKDNSLVDPYLQDSSRAFKQNKDKVSTDLDVIKELLRFVERNPYADDMEIEKFLAQKHDLDSSESRAIIRMIHITEDNLKTASIKQSFDLRDLVGVFDDIQAKPNETMAALSEIGQDPVLIHRALGEDEEPGQINDRPKRSDNPNMSEGNTGLVGPTEDPFASPEGPMAPSANNYIGQGGEGGQGTSGGDSDPMGAGDITSPQTMTRLNEEMQNPSEPNAKGNAIGEAEHDRNVIESLNEKNLPPEVKKQILDQMGIDTRNKPNERKLTSKASKMRAKESKDSGIQVGSSVSYKGENYKVAGTTSTLYGDMIVLSNGQQVMADDDLLGAALPEKKEASAKVTFEKLMEKSSKFFEREYHYTEDELKKMAKKADKLVDEIASYEPAKISEAVGLREQINLLRTASITFRQAAERQALETQAYLDSQPKYHVGMVAEGYDFGQGGGDAIVITAAEMEQEHEDLLETWPKQAATIASQLVEENSQYLGSAGDMRRIASRVIDGTFAHMDAETQDQVRSNFLGFVEKARRLALREMPKKEARVEKELPHQYDEGVFY